MALEYHLRLFLSPPDYILMVIAWRYKIVIIDAVQIQDLPVMPIISFDDTSLRAIPLFHSAVRAYRTKVIGAEAEFYSVYCIAMAFQCID